MSKLYEKKNEYSHRANDFIEVSVNNQSQKRKINKNRNVLIQIQLKYLKSSVDFIWKKRKIYKNTR